jgi:hypothetical protein
MPEQGLGTRRHERRIGRNALARNPYQYSRTTSASSALPLDRSEHMRHLLKFSIPAIAVSLLLAACGSSSSSNTTSSAASTQPAAQTSSSPSSASS